MSVSYLLIYTRHLTGTSSTLNETQMPWRSKNTGRKFGPFRIQGSHVWNNQETTPQNFYSALTLLSHPWQLSIFTLLMQKKAQSETIFKIFEGRPIEPRMSLSREGEIWCDPYLWHKQTIIQRGNSLPNVFSLVKIVSCQNPNNETRATFVAGARTRAFFFQPITSKHFGLCRTAHN